MCVYMFVAPYQNSAYTQTHTYTFTYTCAYTSAYTYTYTYTFASISNHSLLELRAFVATRAVKAVFQEFWELRIPINAASSESTTRLASCTGSQYMSQKLAARSGELSLVTRHPSQASAPTRTIFSALPSFIPARLQCMRLWPMDMLRCTSSAATCFVTRASREQTNESSRMDTAGSCWYVRKTFGCCGLKRWRPRRGMISLKRPIVRPCPYIHP